MIRAYMVNVNQVEHNLGVVVLHNRTWQRDVCVVGRIVFVLTLLYTVRSCFLVVYWSSGLLQ